MVKGFKPVYFAFSTLVIMKETTETNFSRFVVAHRIQDIPNIHHISLWFARRSVVVLLISPALWPEAYLF